MGRRTTVKLLSFDYIAAEGGVAEALGVAAPDLLQRAVRVRAIDGEPFSYLTTHVPEWVGVTFSRQELASRPLLELLERSGVKVEPRHPADQRGACGPCGRDGARRRHRLAADRAHTRCL